MSAPVAVNRGCRRDVRRGPILLIVSATRRLWVVEGCGVWRRRYSAVFDIAKGAFGRSMFD